MFSMAASCCQFIDKFPFKLSFNVEAKNAHEYHYHRVTMNVSTNWLILKQSRNKKKTNDDYLSANEINCFAIRISQSTFNFHQFRLLNPSAFCYINAMIKQKQIEILLHL